MDNELKVDMERVYPDKWSELGVIVLFGIIGSDWMYHKLPPYLAYSEFFISHWSKN